MSNIFKGARPMIGFKFNKNGQSWEVAAIAQHINTVIGKKEGITSAQCVDDFIIINEEIN